ncbi:MAG: TraR/DksA family transcriptional regulator [Nitrospiria bacterium]
MVKVAKKQKKEKKATGPFEAIRQGLIKQREALLVEAGVLLGGGLNPGNEALPDLGDQATAETDKNFTLRLREREQKLLKKIDEAIGRISEGTFGTCESCDGKITPKRLKARPVTTLCIECKTIQEQEEKIRR